MYVCMCEYMYIHTILSVYYNYIIESVSLSSHLYPIALKYNKYLIIYVLMICYNYLI